MLLICGVVTYIAVVQKAGAVAYVGDSVSKAGAPLVGALLLCYVGGIVSAFASTVGVLGAIIPLAVPLLLLGQIDAVSVVASLAIASSIVDVVRSPRTARWCSRAPASTERRCRWLLAYSAVVVAFAPLACVGSARTAWLLSVRPRRGRLLGLRRAARRTREDQCRRFRVGVPAIVQRAACAALHAPAQPQDWRVPCGSR